MTESYIKEGRTRLAVHTRIEQEDKKNIALELSFSLEGGKASKVTIVIIWQKAALKN